MVVPQLHSSQPTPASQLQGEGEGGGSSSDPTVGTSMFVHHYVAASDFRMRVAQFLAPKYDIDPTILVAKMNRFAREFYHQMLSRVASGKPVYNVMFGP